VLCSARVAHDQTPTQPGSDVCVHAEVPKCVAALLPAAVAFSALSDPYVGEEFWSLSRTPPEVGAGLRAVLDLRATALLLRLLVADRQHAYAADVQASYVQRARQFIQENFAASPDVATVAAHVGVSPDYLRHLFQQREGTTLNQMLNRVRIERAKELLRHSRLPLKNIAAQCGFQTDRYFCTRFAAAAGLTPGEFRNQPRGPRPPPLPGENSST
jgi:AraC-like DNA-binding protein